MWLSLNVSSDLCSCIFTDLQYILLLFVHVFCCHERFLGFIAVMHLLVFFLRLIEQLRCGLRAKDVIIEQLEEEKKELVQEAAQRYESRINELTEKLKATEVGADILAQIFYHLHNNDEENQLSIIVLIC